MSSERRKIPKGVATATWYEFPKTHDLLRLEGLLGKIDTDAHLIHEPLRNLNPYGVDIRYPGIETSSAETKTAVKSLKEVRRFVRAKLGLRP